MNLKNHTLLWTFTASYFVLVFVNIHLSFLAFFCLITPFVLLWKDRRKTWCQYYCPRASFFTRMTAKKASDKPIPRWLFSPKVKQGVVYYFLFNLMIMAASTTQVALGKMAPMLMPRFLILFPIPVTLPQLLTWNMPIWSTHLAYRLLSMMLTTTIIGLYLGFKYRSRSWCAICPVATLSDQALQKQAEKV
ncbi:MAG: 4Fe-4S binding protein [Eubacteriales bacterium]|nr:4Fe-4S binding protein [Eubacteriales bacterium]